MKHAAKAIGTSAPRRPLRTLPCALAMASCQLASAGAFAADISYAKYGDYTKYGTASDVPGMCSYEATAKKNYKGRTLKIITHAVPVIGEPTDLHAKQFEDLTGAKVDVVHIPFGDLYQRIMIPFQTGQAAYDVMFYASLWIGTCTTSWNRFRPPSPPPRACRTSRPTTATWRPGAARWCSTPWTATATT